MVRIAPIMTIEAKRGQVIAGTGFIAALDQSGGSTPRALSDYGVAEQVARHGLLPIIEPEVLIDSSSKAEAEDMLPAELTRQTDALPGDWQPMLKLIPPELPDTYASLVAHPRVARVVAAWTTSRHCRVQGAVGQ